MTPSERSVVVAGKRWRLRFVPSLAARGECDPPSTTGKELRIRTALAGEELLEVLLHELLHAAGWPLDEAFVAGFAADAARVLWKLGYREETP